MRKILIIISTFFVILLGSASVFASNLNEVQSFHNIVVFIRFKDETTYEAPYPFSHYEELFNGTDVVSLQDYYLEATYGQLTIDSYLVNDNEQIIFYTDIYDRAYYEPYSEDNKVGVKDQDVAKREHELIKRAVNFVDDENLVPDDLNLDVNDDGQLDSITFMISGEDSGWNSLLWPHKWELSTYYSETYGFTDSAPSINGVHPYIYTWELLGNNRLYENQVNVGVLAHETFHLLSAPDLYHYYDYLQVTPVGHWGLMEYAGTIPSHMLGYMKYRYGNWIDHVPEINESGNYTLYPMKDSPDNIYKIYTGIPNEWIYLEYRDHSGLYESNLPESGLIVYRVNTSINGNEYGSYGSDGIPTDEVFIFRPGMDDTTEPIILEDTEDYNIDGYIDEAALSQYNNYDSIGMGTDIPIFSGDGEILNISITNVTEMNGYLTFNVQMPPSISLETNGFDLTGEDVILYNDYLMDYNVTIHNIPKNFKAYYTLDGSLPTTKSTLYTGGEIKINYLNNHIKVAVFDNFDYQYSLEKEYTFSNSIESNHNPYGNLVDTYWYFDFGDTTNYSIQFNGLCELEKDYDYVSINDGTTIERYTGKELRNITSEHSSNSFIIHLTSDEYLDSYYGFSAQLDIQKNVYLNILGDNEITQTINTKYIDQGAEIIGLNAQDYRLEVINNVQEDQLGDYIVTYNVLDNLNTVILTKSRTVHIVDDIPPTVVLNGNKEMHVLVGDDFVDPFILYSDNFDTNLSVDLFGSVNTSIISRNVLTYRVTDTSGNYTEVTRVVIVEDKEAPIVHLNPGIDTINQGEKWVDNGINAQDNYSENLDIAIIGTIDNQVPGTYEIEYFVYDSSKNVTSVKRIVTVLPHSTQNIEIVCDPFVSTVPLNNPTEISNCYLNGERMNLNYSNINYEIPGIYQITNTLELEGSLYKKIRYIYVFDPNNTLDMNMEFIRRRDFI
jgi:M6 family metalloprotease-like protein